MSDAGLTFTSTAGEALGVLILKLAGPLTLGNLFTFQNEFREMKPDYLIVDMSGVPYMDSAGLGLMVNAFVSAQTGHRQFSLACVSPRLMALLELTKVQTLIPTFADVEEAKRAQL